jgi:hypothetical protein
LSPEVRRRAKEQVWQPEEGRLEEANRSMSDQLQPGNKAFCSGVYKVIHARQHAESHYVILLFGEIFPPCMECSQAVRFELAIAAVHANAHPRFARV